MNKLITIIIIIIIIKIITIKIKIIIIIIIIIRRIINNNRFKLSLDFSLLMSW